MITIYIPSTFRSFSGGRETVEVEGDASLRQVIDRLEQECPGIKTQLLMEGDIHPSIAVFINDEQTTSGLIERVPPEGEIRLLPALGGGTAGE